MTSSTFNLDYYLKKMTLPEPGSHKGQNGKLLIVGGSDLFHAASKWSLDVASKFVDMVFYSSVPSNNDLIHEAKGEFWNGIVIPREEVEKYAEEADCILIGPGMTRSDETETLTNNLLKQFPAKKWVIDAGALQMMDPQLLNQRCIITPHQGELDRLQEKISDNELLKTGVIIVLKGEVDHIFHQTESIEIEGGNAGMTKGGTGDVLAGLIAGLYCTNDAMTSAVVGSYINKKAGDELFKTVGPYFNASDLVEEIPKVLWRELQ
jgi:hydroxyethylthiazole kinase-like uncharacterized protein yjeF